MREQIRKILKELFSGDGSVTFSFRDMKAFKPTYTNAPWRVYFNGLKIKDGQYSHGENTYIDLIGNDVELRGINPIDFMSDGKSGYVDLYKLEEIKPDIREILFGSKDSGKVKSGVGPVTFSFRDMKAYKPTYGPWRVYFNNLETKKGQYSHGKNTYIDLIGNDVELRGINPTDFNFTEDGKSGYVKLYKLEEIKPDIREILFGNKDSGEVKSTLIRSALKKAFPNNWKERDEIYSAGIRDINTIGERTGKGESWSIMNYFDTKKEVQKKISQKWNNEGEGDLEEWLVDVFKNDNNFMKELLDIQWRSIENGYNTEIYASEVISNHIPGNLELFPPGSIIDRYGSIDMIIGGQSFQIKPLSGLLVKDGKYFVKTYGMKKDYKSKKIDYIVYAKIGGKVYVFPNKNYEVSGGGKEVIHFEEPTIY